MHKQSFDVIEPTLAIMQSLTHNIYNHSLKFIIFLSVRVIFREDRPENTVTVFTNKGTCTLNGDTTYFQFHRSFFQKKNNFFPAFIDQGR